MIVNSKYSEEFLCGLLKEVNDKIAYVTNKDYKNSVYNLGSHRNLGDYSDLIEMSRILDNIIKCNTCYNDEDVDIEQVVSMIKNELNNC